ncbi:MAG: acyl carrier protein [Verrucomicrobiae bacterium]|nr:acyl carrier protein [Verrucomicrobiae bacterium]MDW8309688.1 acyl carrier protein [Verrucomicrobiales bacterium]
MNPLRAEHRRQLVEFLRTIQKAGVPVESLRDEDRLVASGLIDSLAILQIVAWLETTYGIDFSVRGVSPEELGSIGGILDVIEQEKGAVTAAQP